MQASWPPKFRGGTGPVGDWGTSKSIWSPPVSGMPLETLPPPGTHDVESFLRRVEERLATLDWPAGLERFRVFAGALQGGGGEGRQRRGSRVR